MGRTREREARTVFGGIAAGGDEEGRRVDGRGARRGLKSICRGMRWQHVWHSRIPRPSSSSRTLTRFVPR